MKYTMNELIRLFDQHAIDAEKEKQKRIAEYREVYVVGELPEELKDEFNLATALRSMCEAIKKLQNSGCFGTTKDDNWERTEK